MPLSGVGFSGLAEINEFLYYYIVSSIITIINILYTGYFLVFIIHLYKIEKRIFMSMPNRPDLQVPKRLAIFASGAGSNAQKIIDHFRDSGVANIVLIVCNNPQAGIVKIAGKENIPTLFIERKNFYEGGYLAQLNNYQIDLIVLAGFLWKIPLLLINSFQNKIINIHPALLPKFGGKNMYGKFVHEAVLQSAEKESGITIHYVDELYDHGQIIFQTTCQVDEGETTETLARKIHSLEHAHYAAEIEKLLT